MMNSEERTPSGRSRKRKQPETLEEDIEADLTEIFEIPEENETLELSIFTNFKVAEFREKEIKNNDFLSIIRSVCYFLDKCRFTNVTGYLKLNLMTVLKYYGMSDLTLDSKKLNNITRKVTRPDIDSGMTVRGVFNLVSLLQRLTKLNDSFKFSKWFSNYLSPPALINYNSTTTIFFSQKVFHIQINVQKAIAEGNWSHIGLILSEIDFNPKNMAGNNIFYSEYISDLFSYRWPEFFNVTFEWIIQMKADPEEKCNFLEQVLICFKETCKFNPAISRNSFVYYLTSCLVYGIANQQENFVNNLLELEIPNILKDAEYFQQFKFYGYLYDYIKILKQSDTSSTDFRWPGIYQKIYSVVESSHNPSKMLIFVEPLVVCAQFTDNREEAMELITGICCQAPGLLPYVADILSRCDERRFIGAVITEVLQSTPENEIFLSKFPLILYFVHQRSLNNATVIKREDAEMHVRMLFEFLDHIQNRAFPEAWECLLVNLKILFPFPDWIVGEWNERRTWWPRFHSVALEDGEEERKQVFDLLEGKEEKKV